MAGAGPRSVGREELRVVRIVFLAFVPFALVVAFVVSQHTSSAEAAIAADHLAHARAAADVSDSFIEGNLSTLAALAQTPGLRGATALSVNGIFAPILRNDPNWLTLGLSGADGLNLSSLSAPPRTVSIADRDYFQAALAGQPAVGSVLVARGTLATKTVVLAVPIRFDDGTTGVLSGALQLPRVEQLLRESLPPAYGLRVVDRRGQEFIGQHATADQLPVVADDPDVRAAMDADAGTTVLRLGGADTLLAYATAKRAGWTILLAEPTATAFLVPSRETEAAVVLTLAGLLAALVIAWYLGRTLARTYFAVETERERLRGALASAPGHVGLLLGPDLRYAVANPEHMRAVGKGPEEVLGRPYREVSPDPRSVAILEDVYRTGEPRRSREARVVMRQSDGSERVAYFDSAIVPVRDAEGKIDGVVYHAIDVTDLVLARERLEELAAAVGAERDELQQVIDASPEGVVVMRADGSTIRNRAAETLIGARVSEGVSDELVATQPRRLDGRPYADDDRPIVRALRRGEVVQGEQLLIRNVTTGQDLPILASAAPVVREGEIVAAVTVFQDISALKAMEAQRSEFFSVASHEIKTPITAIQLQLELAQKILGSGDLARVSTLVGRAVQRTKALAGLVNDLLDVSRIDVGRLELQLAELDLGALVREMVETFPTDETHPLLVQVPDAPAIVHGDRRRLVEIVENLLANAVKYSPEGGAIDLVVSVDGAEATLRVRDRGFGVPPEERPYIFDRFYRTTRARSFGGVGLGLYISREIALRHGGVVRLEETSETGSTFALTLPLAGATRAAAPPTDPSGGSRVAG